MPRSSTSISRQGRRRRGAVRAGRGGSRRGTGWRRPAWAPRRGPRPAGRPRRAGRARYRGGPGRCPGGGRPPRPPWRAAHGRQGGGAGREGEGERWSRARSSAAASHGAAAGSSGSTGVPYGQKVTRRPCSAAGAGTRGGRSTPVSRWAKDSRRARPCGSASAACAFATVSACRTTVPSVRSARVAVTQGQCGAERRWTVALARAARAGRRVTGASVRRRRRAGAGRDPRNARPPLGRRAGAGGRTVGTRWVMALSEAVDTLRQ